MSLAGGFLVLVRQRNVADQRVDVLQAGKGVGHVAVQLAGVHQDHHLTGFADDQPFQLGFEIVAAGEAVRQ